MRRQKTSFTAFMHIRYQHRNFSLPLTVHSLSTLSLVFAELKEKAAFIKSYWSQLLQIALFVELTLA